MRWPGRLSYHALRLLPAEAAHDLGKRAMARGLLGRRPPSTTATTLFGTPLRSPLGLAAGFDKDGDLPGVLGRYGFGFVEVGSVTRRGGPGNPKPRLFRHGPDGLLNRMGLNGEPAEVVAARLRRESGGVKGWWGGGVEQPRGVSAFTQPLNHPTTPPPLSAVPFGVNVAKTHDPAIVGDAAIDDVIAAYRAFFGVGFYHVLNVSCPNTREGKTFEEPSALADLLAAANAARLPTVSATPLCVKLSPTDDLARLGRIVEVCEAAGIDGYVATNTRPHEDAAAGRGGLSGAALRASAIGVVAFLKRQTGRPVIGCGGVIAPADAAALLDAGADAVQAYTGFVRGPFAGPSFAWDVADKIGMKAEG